MNTTRNLFRYCKHADYESPGGVFPANFGFRDRGSRFSILKNQQTVPGPDDCFVHADIDARVIFYKLLGLNISYWDLTKKQSRKLTFYNSMNYYPSHIDEIFFHNSYYPLPPLEGRCRQFFSGTDHLTVIYELTNHSQSEILLNLQWFSEPEIETLQKTAIVKNGYSCIHDQKVVRKYLTSTRLFSHNKGITFSYADGFFRSNDLLTEVVPGKTERFRFEMVFTLNKEKTLNPTQIKNSKVDLNRHIKKTDKFYSSLPELPADCREFKRIVAKAVCTLRSLRYFYRDGKGKPFLTIQTAKCGVGGSWFWDTAFSLQGYGIIHDPKPAYSAARLLLEGIKKDGTPPGCYRLGGYSYFYQQPILAWGIGHFLTYCPNKTFLTYAYSRLCRYVKHWLNEWRDEDSGLSVHPPGGSCWDDSLRWQNRFPLSSGKEKNWYRQDWGEMKLELFANVDTNTYLYLECLTLSRMANVLGKSSDAKEWQIYASRLAEKINTELYNTAKGIYQDCCVKNNRFTEMITPSSFFPLYAGITPKKNAQKICRKYLLNPKHFYTEFPFPTLDRSHPAFRSGGIVASPPTRPESLVQQAYWIGRSWPHISYWMVGALYNSGLKKEAHEAATRILEGMDKSERLYECYDSLTGYGNGHPDYSWSAAAVLTLAYRQYTKDPIGLIDYK